MIILNIEEASTIVKSYAYLMELAQEHDFDLRPEEFRVYDKLTAALAAPYEEIVQEVERTLPHPPADPHREEDAYVPNIVE